MVRLFLKAIFSFIWLSSMFDFVGTKNFRADIKAMLGKKNWGVRLYFIFQICWLFITPGLIIV
jgi:hypothetical protein